MVAHDMTYFPQTPVLAAAILPEGTPGRVPTSYLGSHPGPSDAWRILNHSQPLMQLAPGYLYERTPLSDTGPASPRKQTQERHHTLLSASQNAAAAKRRSIVHSSPPSKTRSGPPRKQLVLFIPPAQAKARYPASLGVVDSYVTPVISKVLRYERDAPRIRQRRGAISFPKGTVLRYERPSKKTEPQMMAFGQMSVSPMPGQQESLGSPVKLLQQHRGSVSSGPHLDERRGSLTALAGTFANSMTLSPERNPTNLRPSLPARSSSVVSSSSSITSSSSSLFSETASHASTAASSTSGSADFPSVAKLASRTGQITATYHSSSPSPRHQPYAIPSLRHQARRNAIVPDYPAPHATISIAKAAASGRAPRAARSIRAPESYLRVPSIPDLGTPLRRSFELSSIAPAAAPGDTPASCTSIQADPSSPPTPNDEDTESELDFCCRGSDHGLSPCSPFYASCEKEVRNSFPHFQIFATLHDERERMVAAGQSEITVAEQASDLGKRRGKPVKNLRLV